MDKKTKYKWIMNGYLIAGIWNCIVMYIRYKEGWMNFFYLRIIVIIGLFVLSLCFWRKWKKQPIEEN